MKPYLIAYFLLFSSISFSQNNIEKSSASIKFIDSLQNNIKSTKYDTTKVNSLNLLTHEFIKTDSLKARQLIQQSRKLAQEINYFEGLADGLNNMADLYLEKKEFKTAIAFSEQSITIYETKCSVNSKNNKMLADYYLNQGNMYYAIADYTNTIKDFQKALKLYEKLDDNKGICKCYQNLGVAHSDQGNYDQSVKYYELTLQEYEKINNQAGKGICYLNIGTIYGMKGEFSKSLEYFQKSLKIRIDLNDKDGIADCYCNIGNVYFFESNFEKAIYYYKKTVALYEELKQKDKISLVLGNIAELNNELKNFKEAIVYAGKSLEIAQEIGALEDEKANYMHLSTAYKGLQNFELALKFHELYKQICDSIFNTEKHKQISELEAIYQNDKKQKEIKILEKDRKLKTEEIRRQTIQKYALLGGFSLMLILATVILFSYRKIKTQKNIIEEKNISLHKQNDEIRSQKDEIEAQRDEISTQRDIVTIQKEQIEEIYQEISDSITYAKRIQQAVLPNLEEILSHKVQIPNTKYQVGLEFGAWSLEFGTFILFKPKDVVSGDFYWASRVNEWLIVTVTDCTGHGVPGAFMSMLGISFLNEIVRKKEITKASHVLDNLRESVIDALKQSGEVGEHPSTELRVQDGMDMAFCAINTETLEMQFAGANNPCWIVSSRQSAIGSLQTEDCRLIDLKPDKQPIGIHTNMEPFTNQIYQLQKGDIIYLMSDGYEDQFGGTNRKKFLSKNLKNLLTANSQQPMAIQKQILETKISEWIGENEQIDDITIMGIKI